MIHPLIQVVCNTYYMSVNRLQTKTKTWLLLLYALPTKRTSARVNLWRKLKRFGAVQLKTSAYVLPDDPVQYERLQWLSEEVRSAGGDASVLRVTEIEGMDREAIIQMFNQARKADYDELSRACRGVMGGARRGGKAEVAAELERQHRRFSEILEIDYFKSPAADDARMALKRLEKVLGPGKKTALVQRLSAGKFAGRRWLTRPRPGIDRAGSAWLIRKFIDAKARFVFASAPSGDGEAIPFDMADVEFSHHGDDCTFETLVKRFGIADRAVLKMAEMVHDADLEDGKFQRCECLGINSVLAGWERAGLSDGELLAKGMECFEGLYRSLQK
jgi:hypothetical protein